MLGFILSNYKSVFTHVDVRVIAAKFFLMVKISIFKVQQLLLLRIVALQNSILVISIIQVLHLQADVQVLYHLYIRSGKFENFNQWAFSFKIMN